MTVLIRENSRLAKIAATQLRSQRVAMVIGSTIHLWGATRQEFLQTPSWVRHEVVHVFQYKKYGVFRFLCLYLWQSARHGYYRNRFELEARAREQEPGLLDDLLFR